MTLFPIDSIIPQLRTALQRNDMVILSAEPGAGKTTRVPVALLDEPWLGGKKILMLEPRRLAALRSAEYMAEQRGERTGETIGYSIRGESTTTSATRIDVVTEGILTRMVQSDASLEGIGLIIFDEFHERSIHADLGLALVLDIRQHLRRDLKILIMSATIDADAVAGLTDAAEVLRSGGRMYPVGVSYLPLPANERIEATTASAALRAVREQEGDVLVFLPGQREIKNTEQSLLQKDIPPGVQIHTLFGEAPPSRQRAALRPAASGERKIILSTNIAETSLTIDGVRVVVDSGQVRTAVFDPRRGMTGLVTIPISKASAEQRKGRAGRQAEGHCYRLWTETQHALLPDFSRPEILTADLAPLAMELAMWGDPDGRTLKFLDPPPASHLRQAQELLRFLGAVEPNGALTPHGKAMGALPAHPRIAHMLLKAKERGTAGLAALIAALLDERDLLRPATGADIDLGSRITFLQRSGTNTDAAVARIREQARRLCTMVGVRSDAPVLTGEKSARETGILLALAYPDRIAKRKQGEKYQLSGNTVAVLPKESGLFREEYLAVADVDGAGNDVRILLAEPVDVVDLRTVFAEQIVTSERLLWDETAGAVAASVVSTL
ncbi:MAG: ATP-dependent helicase HrpB, partial [Bacteroidetes bacterium]|nr:ATP-dependent helicase HrpB [Bacteroidota bacterium]